MTLLLLPLLACGPKEVPKHLRMEAPAEEEAPTAPPTDLQAAARRLTRADPLLRRADPEVEGTWDATAQARAIEAWARVARQPDAPAKAWQQVETSWPGTLAVPLVRGGRLAWLEAATATGIPDADAGLELLPWLGPVVVDAVPLPPAARGPLAWLGGDLDELRPRMLHIAERAVLLGWLDDPSLPVEAAAGAMAPGVHDRLRDSPTGQLLIARAEGRTAPDRGAAGALALEQATSLALQAVAADRDRDQERWRETRDALLETLGEDPIAALLRQAATELTADAADPTSTGLAIVGLSAERVHGSCPDKPCHGLDRTATLRVAPRWSDEAEAAAAVWRVIAFKAAFDSLVVTRERVGVPSAWLDLADALLGTTDGSVRHALLRTRRPDQATWLDLSRMVGDTDATTWDAAEEALEAHLLTLIEHASAKGPPAEQREVLDRLARRLR